MKPKLEKWQWDKLEGLLANFKKNKKVLELLDEGTPEYDDIFQRTDKIMCDMEKIVGTENLP